jgi:hypothetical protein
MAVSLAIVLAACGGPMSETEYVEDLNALVATAGSDLEAAGAAFAQTTDPTLEEFVAFVDQQLTVEYGVRERFKELDPPDSIGEVHQVMVDTLARILAVAEGVTQVADTVDSLEEMEQTPEFAEYYGVNAEADSMCFDVQAKINDLATRPVIDNPWITDLRLIVEAFLDCDEVATG